MKPLQNQLKSLINRSVDRHLRLAVTGLSRSGKTAFITAFVNQLLTAQHGARLPMLSALREGRFLGAKRIPQSDLGIARFAYDEGIAALFDTPPRWPIPTRGISEIQLAIRYHSHDTFRRYLKETSTLYLEIVDYPGEWLLDLPMLAQDYFSWSQQMSRLLQNNRQPLATAWVAACQEIDPFAPADENRLAEIAHYYTAYLLQCKQQGHYFIQPGRFVLPGDMADAPALQFFPWPFLQPDKDTLYAQASSQSYLGMLRHRFDYYCQHVVKVFYRHHFQRFDRQIVLIDCLQALNSGPDAFNDMRLALTQLMQSFQYGQRTLFRRLFSPVIDKLLFAASKADHVTTDQHSNLVSLLQQLVQAAWQQAAFEGIQIDCAALASVQATQNGKIQHQGQSIPALRGERLSDGQPLTFYPGEVPGRLPNNAFWQQQHFDFENFRPPQLLADSPLPHIRLDSAIEFLIGDKLR